MSSEVETSAPSGAHSRSARPWWMLALLAFGMGPLLARALFNEPLSALVSQIVNAFDLADSRSHVHLVRLAVRVVLPSVAAVVFLRFTPLGRWIAFTPLTLACLVVGDTLLLLNIADQVRLFVSSGYPTYRFTGEFTAGVAMAALAGAAISLTAATAWYRSEASRHWMNRNSMRWLREA